MHKYLQGSKLIIRSILTNTIIVVSTIISIVLMVILLNSSNKPSQYKDPFGNKLVNSISEKNSITIDGVKLGFFIKGINKKNPVLLYLHGGMPDYFLTSNYPTGLDSIFTVVWLDQRGSDLSFDSNIDYAKINTDSLVKDIKLFSDYLIKRFSQEKIYLMAHSGGTYLGVKTIDKYPELYKAYIAVAQITNQKLSEKMAYDFIVDKYKYDSDKFAIYKDLIKDPVDLKNTLPKFYLQNRDCYMHDLGIGTMRNMNNIFTGIFLPSLLFNEYSMIDKINFWRGKAKSGISTIWNEIASNDLTEQNISFKIPVYFFHGIYDYTCSYQLARRYFNKIRAPKKGFFSFKNSAHSPIFEEPSKCINIIKTKIIIRNSIKTF